MRAKKGPVRILLYRKRTRGFIKISLDALSGSIPYERARGWTVVFSCTDALPLSDHACNPPQFLSQTIRPGLTPESLVFGNL
jgi:hypothetical protein